MSVYIHTVKKQRGRVALKPTLPLLIATVTRDKLTESNTSLVPGGVGTVKVAVSLAYGRRAS